MTRIETFHEHVLDLARLFKVAITWLPPGIDPDNARAGFFRSERHLPMDDRRKLVLFAPITDETTYAAALHELGHCLHPLGMLTMIEGSPKLRLHGQPDTLRDVRLQLECERAAWQWARHYALEWTDLMSSVETMCYATYQRRARQFGVRS